MSALSATLSARLAKLLPRLASDQQGEVAAVAAAVTRTLRAEGCDWHDLAAHVAEGPREIVVYREHAPQPGPSPFNTGAWRQAYRPRSMGSYRERVFRCQNASAGRLNEWEAGCLLSVCRQLECGRTLSARQIGILGTIEQKLGVSE